MSIKEFEYLDIATETLKEKVEELYIVSNLIQDSFHNILSQSNLEFLNISSRVKSPESLSEKILRNKYYKKHTDATKLIYNLSDLIGVRIECRFGDDEREIYRYLKKYFNIRNDGNYYNNDENENIYIKLEGKQPQKQKNGFNIYRIDGKYLWMGVTYPFELQIKSLVNMFWGEIEHEIIYKNSNYIIEDKFLKDIMGSIKNNLSMIDKQLITVFNQFESKKKTDISTQKKHLEDIVSKMIYDLFSNKMKESIGMTVDFKKSCETIVRYTFEIDNTSTETQYNDVLIKALNRINEISSENIDFNSNLILERKVKYKDEFTKILGTYFQEVFNNEFSWNLFFRILFTLEPLNNVGDFETFLTFLKLALTESPYISKQKSILSQHLNENITIIEDAIIMEVAKTLVEIDSIEIVYDYNISEINSEIESIYRYIANAIFTLDDWTTNYNNILADLKKNIKEIILH